MMVCSLLKDSGSETCQPSRCLVQLLLPFHQEMMMPGSVPKTEGSPGGEAQDLLAEKTVLFPLVFRNVLTGSNPEKVDGFEPIACTGLQLVGVSVK